MPHDAITGFFAFGGALAIGANVLALYRAKRVEGVNLGASAFFALGSVWNVYWYASIGQWLALAGGTAVATMNCVWIVLAIYYRRKENGLAGI